MTKKKNEPQLTPEQMRKLQDEYEQQMRRQARERAEKERQENEQQ